MTTVLTVPGAFSYGNMATVQSAFGGPQSLLNQLGDSSVAKVVGVVYNDWDATWGAQDGANKIAAQIKSLPPTEKIVILGHSYGAVANCVLLRTPSLLAGIDPARITLVNAANSIRPGNGYWSQLGGYLPAGPVSSTFKVYDVAREYDRWADAPNVFTSQYFWQANGNVGAGDVASGTVNGVPNNIHNSYQNVSLTDPTNAQITIGTVTFVLTQTDPMPSPSGASWANIDTAYNRIVAPRWLS